MNDAARTATARRPPGRPRSERSHLAIIRATVELLVEGGFQSLTMEQVQRRAGVGKATIYRRWGSKEDLVKDAIQYFGSELPVPDTGTLAGDYAEISAAVMRIAKDRGGALLMPRLLVEASGDPELHAIFNATLVEPRRRVLRIVLERARERGELRADVDVELAIDMIAGPVIYRFLVSGGDVAPTAAAAPRMLQALLEGLRPPAPGR
jgi:AcrR family transcriptional regulator